MTRLFESSTNKMRQSETTQNLENSSNARPLSRVIFTAVDAFAFIEPFTVSIVPRFTKAAQEKKLVKLQEYGNHRRIEKELCYAMSTYISMGSVKSANQIKTRK